MAITYYTLEEAARLLNVSPDELKLMSRRGKPRPFKDGGTFQFRVTEIDEMARERGGRSDPDMPLREGQPPKKRTSGVKRPASEAPTLPPAEGKKRTSGLRPSGSEAATIPPPSGPPKRRSEVNIPPADEGVFDFELTSEDVDVGKAGAANKPPKSGSKLAPTSGSDSDVRLVPDGSAIDFEVASESKARKADSPVPKRKSEVKAPGKQRDSSVKLVPESPSDSDVKLVQEGGDAVNLDEPKSKTASDSDVRLEKPTGPSGRGKDKKGVQLTEEIDLDAELEGSSQKKSLKGGPALPTKSPFDLSAAEAKGGVDDLSDELIPLVPDDDKAAAAKDESDDFELTVEDSALEHGKPARKGTSDEMPSLNEGSPIARPDGSSELELALDDSSPVSDLEPSPLSGEHEASSSPKDEDSSSEFELSLDEAPAGGPSEKDSSSEFELSIDESGAPVESGEPTSEFELSLDEADEPQSTSDSEFDLTLEPGSSDELEQALAEGKDLADVEESEESPAAEKDIFETDFDVPTLDEESGSEAVAIEDADTDLDETSDFGVAIDDDLASEEPSGSQVVALEDEEEVDDAAATVARRRKRRDQDEDELDEDQEVIDEEEAEVEARREAVGAGAPARVRWGPLPALFMIPTVILTLLVGLMCWETLNLMWGHHQGQKVSGVITPWLAYDVFGMDKPEGSK